MKKRLLTCVFSFSLALLSVIASDFVNAAIINIPDPQFKSYLVDNFDTDGDDEISDTEAEAVTVIDTPGSYSQRGNISDLTGIESFINLLTLDCSKEMLTSLPDLSALTNLQDLICFDNQLTSLPDLSALTNLQRLICGFNQLTDVPDLFLNKNLDYLNIQHNLLDTGDCMDILELESRNLTSFVYNPQNGGDLDCASLDTAIDFSNGEVKGKTYIVSDRKWLEENRLCY